MRIIKTNELYDMGIVLNSFNPSSPSPIHNRENISGRNGFVDLGTQYDGRLLNIKVTILPGLNKAYTTARTEVFNLFDSRQPFILEHENRQWIVKCNNPYSFKRKGNSGEAKIRLISDMPYTRTVGTTLEPITFRNEQTLIEAGLNLTEYDYIHTTSTFKIYNPGERIDPRELDLKIHFKGVSSNLSIKNNTNATEWIYNASTVDTDVILLDGIRSFKNGISIFKDTNYGVIELNNGWNEFTINGATDFEIKFEHRFYYI